MTALIKIGYLFAILIATPVLAQIDIACVGAPDGMFVRSSTSCSHWHYCVGEKAVRSDDCGEQEEAFDALSEKCAYRGALNCKQCSLFGRQNLSILDKNNKYVNCTDGVGVEAECVSGFIFNPKSGYCDIKIDIDVLTTDNKTNDNKEEL